MCFNKAGESAWAAIIPFYDKYLMTKLGFGHVWLFWIQLALVALVPLLRIPSTIASIILFVIESLIGVKFFVAFGINPIMSIIFALLPIIGYPMVAFGNAEYYGP